MATNTINFITVNDNLLVVYLNESSTNTSFADKIYIFSDKGKTETKTCFLS